jgi:surfactin synthase thioesterase subunit
MGSLVAFATARRAMDRGLPTPFWLGASGRHAPHLGARRYMIHKLSDDALTDVVRAIGGTPMDLLADPRDRARFLDPLRADFEACETYHPAPEPRLPLPITSYVGTDDPTVTPDEVRAWAQLTSSDFELRRFTGGHFYMTGSKAEVAHHLTGDVREALHAAGGVPSKNLPRKTA